jgi:hypothetical protein
MRKRNFSFQDVQGKFLQAINVRGSVHTIAIDHVQKALLIGTQDTLKVFEMEEYTCVQTNDGHTDVIQYRIIRIND